MNKAKIDELDRDVQKLDADLQCLDKIIRGSNGDGIRTRLSKLEDRMELVLKVMWATFGAVLMLIIATIWEKLV